MKKHQKKQSSAPIILCAVVFLMSGILLGSILISEKHKEDTYTQMALQMAEDQQTDEGNAIIPTIESTDSSSSVSKPVQMLPHMESLYQQNPDFAGWLTVPNTRIDYPVVFDPPKEPEYYLHRSFDGTYSFAGVPFVGAGADMSSDCLIIYGHNMRDGSMFHTLTWYQNPDFWEDNPAFTFSSLYEEQTFSVFSAVKCRILQQNEEGFRYYNHCGALTQEEYEALVDWLIDNSMYDTGLIPEYGQQIIILSTCNYHTTDGRFIVAGFLRES